MKNVGANTWLLNIAMSKETIKFFFCIRPPTGFLPVLGPLERYMTPTLDVALQCSSRAGSDLGLTHLDRINHLLVR